MSSRPQSKGKRKGRKVNEMAEQAAMGVASGDEEVVVEQPPSHGRGQKSSGSRITLRSHKPSDTESLVFVNKPVFIPSGTEPSVSATISQSSRKRAKSPTKHMGDLALLNKPVRYATLDLGHVPKDIITLVDDLEGLCDNTGVVPSAIFVRRIAERRTEC